MYIPSVYYISYAVVQWNSANSSAQWRAQRPKVCFWFLFLWLHSCYCVCRCRVRIGGIVVGWLKHHNFLKNMLGYNHILKVRKGRFCTADLLCWFVRWICSFEFEGFCRNIHIWNTGTPQTLWCWGLGNYCYTVWWISDSHSIGLHR